MNMEEMLIAIGELVKNWRGRKIGNNFVNVRFMLTFIVKIEF